MSTTLREASLRGVRRGLQFYAQGRHVEALQALDRALELDDTICLTWIGKGKALLALERPTEALAAFERALSFDPTSSEALRGKAQASGEPGKEKGWSLADELGGDWLGPLVELLISLLIHS